LVTRLRDCGVFGIMGDELLTWVTQNRNEWKRSGENLVRRWHKDAILKYRVNKHS
jgi:hypothetical protein